MNHRLETILITIVLSCGATASAWGNNIVTNGSFEGTTYIGPNGDVVATGWTLLPPNSVSLSKFNIENTIDAITFKGPEDGSNYAAFASPETDGSQDCLYTVFNTIPGQQYVVSFWVAITAAATSNTLLLPQWNWAQAGQQNMIDSFYYGATNTGPVNYRFFTFVQTAVSTTSNIMFHGTDSNGEILVDNVAVSEAPEPASMLLIGSVLAIIGLRRARSLFPIN